MSTQTAGFQITPLCEADLDQVLVIEGESFPRPWTRQHFLDEITSPTAVCSAARGIDNQLLGFLILRIIHDEAEVMDVAVAAHARRMGLGRVLMDHALTLCRQRRVSRLWLEVRVSSIPAISLYESLGFRESGVRKCYYENSEDALVMDILLGEDSDAVSLTASQ